jgi:hypothetical protein
VERECGGQRGMTSRVVQHYRCHYSSTQFSCHHMSNSAFLYSRTSWNLSVGISIGGALAQLLGAKENNVLCLSHNLKSDTTCLGCSSYGTFFIYTYLRFLITFFADCLRNALKNLSIILWLSLVMAIEPKHVAL